MHENIYQIPDLFNMVCRHLNGAGVNTEFSSWGACLSVAMNYLVSGDPEARISMIATRKYPNTAIYHCPSLQNASLCDGEYAHEYLVHRVVQGGPGSGYKSILWSDLAARGIDDSFPQYYHGGPPHFTVTVTRARHAKHIASAYRPEFVVPFTAALLSSWLDVDSELRDEVKLMRAVLYEDTETEVENFLGEANIMEDIVYISCFTAVKQFILLLRMLTEDTHGKNAKKLNEASMRKLEEQGVRQLWANRTL